MLIVYPNEYHGYLTSEFCNTNIGIIKDNGNFVIIDPGVTLKEIQFLMQIPAKFLINTHWHWDHILGNHYFPDSTVISQNQCISNITDNKQNFIDEIMNEKEIQRIIHFPDWKLRLPDIGITNYTRILFHTHPIELFPITGHSNDDLLIIHHQTAFCGDYLSDTELPSVNHCIFEYIQTLQLFRNLFQKYSVNLLIPGHGNIAEKQEIFHRIDCHENHLTDLLTKGNKLYTSNISAEIFRKEMISDETISREDLEFYELNCDAVFNYLRKKEILSSS